VDYGGAKLTSIAFTEGVSCTPKSATSPWREFLEGALGKFPGLSGKR
jgi:hypothetical protein